MHAVVVLVPLAALGAIALAIRAPWRRSFGPLVALLALAGALSATGAKLAGDQLAAYLEAAGQDPAPLAAHGQFGLYTLLAVWPFAVLAVVAAVLARRDRSAETGGGHRATTTVAATSTPVTVTTWLAAAAGVVALAFTVVAGDSGSRLVWGFVTGG